MKLYLVQMRPECNNPAANLAKIMDHVDQGLAAGANLIAFGECALHGYDLGGKVDYARYAEPVPGPATDAICERIKDKHCLVTFGMAERDGDDIYNAAPLLGPDGVIGIARKLYLVHLVTKSSGKRHAEDEIFKHGQRVGIFDTEFGRIGIQICLDNRHPEIAQAQAAAGCWLKIRPAAVPARPNQPTTHPMDLARGVENQMCDLFVNLVGDQGGVYYKGGTSVILGSKGVQKQASVGPEAQEEALEYEVTPEDVAKAKGIWDNIAEIRPEIVKQLWELAEARRRGGDIPLP